MDEFTRQYAASQQDADKVANVLGRFHLRIEETSLVTRSMRVSGTVAQMEAAFHPRLAIYLDEEQGEFRDREGNYQVPVELKGIVTGILGFGQRQVARRNSADKTTVDAQGDAPLTPADLERRYNFPVGTAEGQKIAIAEFGGGYFPNDLAAYCAKAGRPQPTVNIRPLNLEALTLEQIMQLPDKPQQEELSASGEVMMDVQIVAGLCPAAQIDVYFATFDQKGWVDLLNAVIKERPVTLSVSWGRAEDSKRWAPAAIDAISERLNAAALLGITICVASGDDGSGDEMTDGRAHVDFPGSSDFVLSVGGTMLTGTGANVVEEVWWVSPGRRTGHDDGSTGGGVSTIVKRPSWQNVSINSLNKGSIDGRVVPDVAALAGDPGYDLILLNKDRPNGGTSASAPLWAALIARINALLPSAKQQRFLTPLLYQNGPNGQSLGKSACRDITVGQNASLPKPGVGYKAGKGFDAVSGWGVPIGTSLLAGL